MGEFFWVGAGGFLGSTLRWALVRMLALGGMAFPWPVAVVNLLGSFALGTLLGRAGAGGLSPFVGMGLLGGFTTFSAFSSDNLLLFQRGAWGMLSLNLLVQPVLGLAGAWWGHRLTS